jgi:F0F1-type ATP synthase epsilon subunit
VQLTLGQVLDRLHSVHQDMAAAQRALRQARDAETHAAEAHRMAVARATLSGDCPRPKRGENGVTVADRDAWVDTETSDARFAAAVAEATRKAAEDALRVARDQASVVQSLSALMRAEMQLTQTPGAP